MGVAMRIAMVAWEAVHAVPIGGVGVHVFELARELVHAGHEVHLFTRKGAGQALRDLIDGIWYHRIPVPESDPFPSQRAQFLRATGFYLKESLPDGTRYDILHCHDWISGDLAASHARTHASALVATFHTTERSRTGCWPESPAAKRVAAIERDMCLRADAVIPVSHAVRNDLEMLYDLQPWKTTVIYHGIRPSLYDRHAPHTHGNIPPCGFRPDSPLVVFLGRLIPQKRPDLFLQALHHARRAIPNLQAAVLGDGPLADSLIHAAAELDRPDAPVRVLPHPSPPEIAALLGYATVACLPYAHDPYGISVLSAWAARTPVLLAEGDAAGLEFLHPGSNGLVAPPDPDAYGESLREMLSDPDQCAWMGQNGRTAVDTAFSWSVVAEQTLSVYGNTWKQEKKSEEFC